MEGNIPFHCTQKNGGTHPYCAFNTCVGACSNGSRDGDETDVDCGGPTCSKCGTGKQCLVNEDCASGSCVDGCVNCGDDKQCQ